MHFVFFHSLACPAVFLAASMSPLAWRPGKLGYHYSRHTLAVGQTIDVMGDNEEAVRCNTEYFVPQQRLQQISRKDGEAW